MNSIDLFTYLVNKLDSHSRKIKTIKHSPFDNNTDSFSIAESNRRNLVNFYSELEEDLRQAAFAIKNLINEINSIFLNSKKEIEVLKQNQEFLIAENENLKLKLLPFTQLNCNTDYDIPNKQFSQNKINDVNNIILNMQQNKVRIKEAIKKHFNVTEDKKDDNTIKISKELKSNKENNKMKLTKEKKTNNNFSNRVLKV